MKTGKVKKYIIGISLLMISSLTLTIGFFLAIAKNFSYWGVFPEGEKIGLSLSGEYTKLFFIQASIIFTSGILLCFLISKFFLSNKTSFWISLLIPLICFIILIPKYLRFKESFIKYHNKSENLSLYLDDNSIEKVEIIKSGNDTIKFASPEALLKDIGSAYYVSGFWKYSLTTRLLITWKNGQRKYIITDGHLYDTYKGKVFMTDSNVLEKYISNKP